MEPSLRCAHDGAGEALVLTLALTLRLALSLRLSLSLVLSLSLTLVLTLRLCVAALLLPLCEPDGRCGRAARHPADRGHEGELV